MTPEQLLALVVALSGFGGIIALLVNVGKKIGWVKDGQAPMVSTGLSLLLMVVVYALKWVNPDFDIATLDPKAQQLAEIGALILQFVLTNLVAKATHETVKGTPVIGTYFVKKEPTDATKSEGSPQ